jgi:hypothetical protein
LARSGYRCNNIILDQYCQYDTTTSRSSGPPFHLEKCCSIISKARVFQRLVILLRSTDQVGRCLEQFDRASKAWKIV